MILRDEHANRGILPFGIRSAHWRSCQFTATPRKPTAQATVVNANWGDRNIDGIPGLMCGSDYDLPGRFQYIANSL
jgi:hypothetical protein